MHNKHNPPTNPWNKTMGKIVKLTPRVREHATKINELIRVLENNNELSPKPLINKKI